MILSNTDVSRYKLPTECEGAIFKYQKQRVGAEIVCPQCVGYLGKSKKVDMVAVGGVYNFPTKFTSIPSEFRGNLDRIGLNINWEFQPNDPLFCPHCGVKGIMKGGTPTGHYFARLVLKDGREVYSATKLNLKSDKPNVDRVRQILLGRIRVALKTNRQFYWGKSRAQRKEHKEI